MKRKRNKKDASESVKRLKTGDANNHTKDSQSTPTVLRLYYPQILTLREYLLEIALTSKNKRRRISNYGTKSARGSQDEDVELTKILDNVLVGCHKLKEELNDLELETELSIFSTQVSCSASHSSISQSGRSFAEIVDFSVWQLFRKHTSGHRPPHVLCHGYLHAGVGDSRNLEEFKTTTINGLVSYDKNEHVDRLKSREWAGLPALLGAGGTKILTELLQDCGMFVPLEGGRCNYLQISGVPLSELRLLHKKDPQGGPKKIANAASSFSKADRSIEPRISQSHNFNSIRIVRHRMLYRKPEMNARGGVAFGLPHIHTLNRTRSQPNEDSNIHVMKYIFPRQFNLHNAFTSEVSSNDTTQQFKDYTLREIEIESAKRSSKKRSLPKRLRGQCEELVHNLRTRHCRCAYSALLHYYCPSLWKSGKGIDADHHDILQLATSRSQVSAFCRAIVAKVFPGRFWGDGEAGETNKARIMHEIDRFIKLNRYESLMLHEIMQDIKISAISWLRPPNVTENEKLSAPDFAKRKEVFAELVYYLFDSFVIPLVANNFHITESSSFRNKLFYFRHDVWKKLSEPALAKLRTSMFEELGQSQIRKTLSRRAIGTSRVRLLPKDSGLRPIINLKRRVQTRVNGKIILGRSINSVLTPAFHVLNFEKAARPERLGSSMFSADDIYPRLHKFRAQLQQAGNDAQPLYFAKVDVKSCFDSIPQVPLLKLLDDLLSTEDYLVTRHAEAKALEDRGRSEQSSAIAPKAAWKYLGRAHAVDQKELFSVHAKDKATHRLGTVFVDLAGKKRENRIGILDMLREHIERNIVQIGKKYYRQTTGIPQGSIVSSLLCNFFYAELEQEVLTFVQDGESLLLRLIDDFLLISTNRDIASRFVQLMHNGLPKYGLTVKDEKTKVNFDVHINGRTVARLPAATKFPYCGNAIDTVNLNITRDETRRQQNNTAAAVTVEHSRLPGQTFYRKTFNMLKLHMHTMHLCTRHNLVETVIGNAFRMFADTAERCFHYTRSLARLKRPSCVLMIKTIDDLIDAAYGLMKRKRDRSKDVAYACALSKTQTRWLACHSFERVFARRQTGYGGLMSWLRRQRTEAGLALKPRERQALEALVRQ